MQFTGCLRCFSIGVRGPFFSNRVVAAVDLCRPPTTRSLLTRPMTGFSPRRLTLLPLPRPQVIYALNTKNDEHEEELESLKEAHEDEVRALNGAAHEKRKGHFISEATS